MYSNGINKQNIYDKQNRVGATYFEIYQTKKDMDVYPFFAQLSYTVTHSGEEGVGPVRTGTDRDSS